MAAMRARGKREGAHPVDVHVGIQLRLRRTLLGLSQQRLGEALGLTFQQVQKYERGTNRIGASRLFELSRILEVPVGYFFQGAPEGPAGTAAPQAAGLAEQSSEFEADVMRRRETIELVRAYYGIPRPRVRRRLYELLKALGER